jgi:acyl carrier protein
MTDAWPESFMTALRGNLGLVSEDGAIPGNARLLDLGMDSASLVALVIKIEDEFGVQFPDELLTPETFETPATLWQAVCTLPGMRWQPEAS